jgi:hypothetical protein
MNHLDLYVPDVRATVDFLTTHFELKLVEMRGQNGLAILNDDAGMEIVISHPVEKFGGSEQVSLERETYHIGFVLPCREDVDRIWQRLRDVSTCELSEPRAMRGGWLFYCTAPGRISIEVGWRPHR